MPQFFPQVFITGVVLFLLLGAGYGITQAARAIPWDCADWQAFAHDDRTTAILESLAENRGKTLYCGIDQSDTFAKAETWQAGKDRNERDDTVYQGERGRFRGFLASQEGWLTEGESGVTGVSRDRIFEFPREESKRRTIRCFVPADPSRVINGPTGGQWTTRNGCLRGHSCVFHFAQYFYDQCVQGLNGSGCLYDADIDWKPRAKERATAYCRSIGYTRARGIVSIPPASDTRYSVAEFRTSGWGYINTGRTGVYANTVRAYQTREWKATCEKKGARR